MSPFIQLNDRLWLNLDHVIMVRRWHDGVLDVELSSALAGADGCLRLRDREADALLSALEAGGPEELSAAGEGDGLVETWGLVEHHP